MAAIPITRLTARAEQQDLSRLRLLLPAAVAELTGLSVETLAQWRSQRRGPAFVKLSRNRVGYRVNDLDEWLAARVVTPHSASGRD